MARAVWKAGRAGLNEVFTVIAAGPACDDIMNGVFQFPTSFLSSVAEKEKEIFLSTIREKAPQIEPNSYNALWADYIQKATDVLRKDKIKLFHQSLAARIIKAEKEHHDSFAGDDIMALWTENENKDSRQQAPGPLR